MPENLAVWELWTVAGSLLYDGFGGLSLSNARQVAEAMGIPWDLEIMVKLAALAEAVREAVSAGKHG